jgi:pimeloyl-ACP methyl ester carboxylesterase
VLRHDNQRSDPIGSPVMTPNPNRATATLVFVHGACFGPWVWAEHLMPHFAALGLRCFAPDLHEAWPQAQWSASIARFPIARYTDRLHSMLDQLSGPKILIGHAMGARIVEGLIERGARDGAVLIAPTPPEGLEGAMRDLLMRFPSSLSRMVIARRPRLMFGDPVRADPESLLQRLLSQGDDRHSRELADLLAARLRDESFAACRDWLRPSSMSAVLQTMPVLAIGGREDPLVTPSFLRHAAAQWGAAAHVVPHAGHLPMLGAGAMTVARHIERWLFD